MLKPDYPIVTERLLLRPYTPADLDALHDIQSRPEVARYLYWDARDRDEVREALQRKIASSVIGDENGELQLAVVLPESGTLIGDVVLMWTSREHRQGEVGYVFHPDHGGRGYATEAAEVMLRLGFEGLGLHRLVGRLDGRNTASARVLERLGMRREAHLIQNEIVKGEWTDEVIYAMLEDEWRARA
ncbi:GNAT family N-acetyltransferase [Actinoallomurus rhizosphaericola]|uniref:GNAT family N-acetyltransferase n=1 Tax=Actinoallomurus rhizosphaericola TaxID=2952536 RepID=UPI0020928F12|nr:GNAT family protein [Actinoallomurus rhizosphaericola]MCO6000245.1 GNAT family N-acetyltransferase [Actinoallomurus rhizosphaericola]